MEKYHHQLLKEAVVPGLEIFIPSFCADRCVDLKELKGLVADGKFPLAIRIAHQWKGYCEPYGFAVLGLLAADLEEALKKSEVESVQKLIQNIDQYFLLRKINCP